MFPRTASLCLGFRQRRPNVRRTAQCRDFSDISKRARQPGRSNRGSTGTTKFVKVLLSNRAHNSRRSETNSLPGGCWMSLKLFSTTLYPHHGDPSPKPPAVGSSQVTQRESGIETDLGSPSGERPAAFPILVEAVERVMAHDRKLRHRVDTFTLKACIDSLQRELAKVDGCIDPLQRELALAAGHRANFERDRADWTGAGEARNDSGTFTAHPSAKPEKRLKHYGSMKIEESVHSVCTRLPKKSPGGRGSTTGPSQDPR